jgi:hypothetical protein
VGNKGGGRNKQLAPASRLMIGQLVMIPVLGPALALAQTLTAYRKTEVITVVVSEARCFSRHDL